MNVGIEPGKESEAEGRLVLKLEDRFELLHWSIVPWTEDALFDWSLLI
mgnify:CR=1 FL=1|jgi:hypothetical protein